jgi:hypothetical protein
MPEPAIPPGHVLVRIDDLVRLAAAPGPADSAPPAAAANDTLTLAAALTAIGVLTARINWPGVTQAESLGGEPPEPVIRALALFCEQVLAAVFPDKGAAFLERLASCIAEEAAR